MLLSPAQDLHSAGAQFLYLDLTCQVSQHGILSYPPTWSLGPAYPSSPGFLISEQGNPCFQGCVPHPGRHTVLWSDVLWTQPPGQGQWYHLPRKKPWDPPLMGLCWLGENVGHLAQYANPPMPQDVPQRPWSWATLRVTGGSKSGEAHPRGGPRPPGQPTHAQPRGQ